MSQYPPHQEDPRYPNQKRPVNKQPSSGNPQWDNSGWGSQQSQPQTNNPYAPPGGQNQYGQYGQHGQYAPPSQQPQPGYGQYGDQGQYEQYGPPSQYGQTQQGWGYGASAPQSQHSAYGEYGQYSGQAQQSPYVPYGSQPPPYGYPAPGQQDLDYDYDDAPPRKSRRGIYTILSIFGVVIVIMVICGVLANIPPPAPAKTASIAGTWYGRTNIAANNIGTVTAEAYLNLQQKGTVVTGTGKLCVNKQGKAFEYMNFIINGSMSGTSATMTWHYAILTTGAKGDGELSGTLSQDTLSLIEQDQTGNLTLGVKKGTEQEYLAACRQLPGS